MSKSQSSSPRFLLLNAVAIVAAVAVLAGDFRHHAVSSSRQDGTASTPSAPGLEEILRIAKLQIQNWQKNQS